VSIKNVIFIDVIFILYLRAMSRVRLTKKA